MEDGAWHIISPISVVHVVRTEQMLRKLCSEEALSYERLSQHVGYVPMKKANAKPPKQVKGWRLVSKAQWLQCGDTAICVVGEAAKNMIEHVNSTPGHPLCGLFKEEDHERLAHLLNSGWVWSNSKRVDHMHGWQRLSAMPLQPERFLLFIAKPSVYAPDPVPPGPLAAAVRFVAVSIVAPCALWLLLPRPPQAQVCVADARSSACRCRRWGGRLPAWRWREQQQCQRRPTPGYVPAQ
jgi:hypothetical protein